jgi:hypothetical protein
VGVFHPGPARIALITQCDFHITYHSTVPNRFSHQFDPVVQPIYTIHSDANIRIAQRTEAARLAAGLMAAPLTSTNIQEALDAACSRKRRSPDANSRHALVLEET